MQNKIFLYVLFCRNSAAYESNNFSVFVNTSSVIAVDIVIGKYISKRPVLGFLLGGLTREGNIRRVLTHYHTMPHIDALKIYSCRKHCEKRRNCL